VVKEGGERAGRRTVVATGWKEGGSERKVFSCHLFLCAAHPPAPTLTLRFFLILCRMIRRVWIQNVTLNWYHRLCQQRPPLGMERADTLR
jgi:hypothetical protein